MWHRFCLYMGLSTSNTLGNKIQIQGWPPWSLLFYCSIHMDSFFSVFLGCFWDHVRTSPLVKIISWYSQLYLEGFSITLCWKSISAQLLKTKQNKTTQISLHTNWIKLIISLSILAWKTSPAPTSKHPCTYCTFVKTFSLPRK